MYREDYGGLVILCSVLLLVIYPMQQIKIDIDQLTFFDAEQKGYAFCFMSE